MAVIRKKGVGFLLGIFAVLLALILLFSDRLIEWAMETAGSMVVGAKVEFEGVDFSIFKIRLEWQHLQVANPNDPWYNLFETGYSDLNLRFEPLLYKRFIVQNMQSDSIRFGTKRETNGALPGRTTESADYVEQIQDQFHHELEQIPAFKLTQISEIDVDSIMEAIGIQTPQKLDSLQNVLEGNYDSIANQIETLRNNRVFGDIRNQIDTIQVQQVEGPDDVTRTLETLNEARRRIDSLRTIVKNANAAIERDLLKISQYNTLVGQWVQQDTKKILALADLPNLSPEAITRSVFGPMVIRRFQSLLTYIGTARYYGEKIKELQPEKEESPPRLEGQTIRFSHRLNWPTLWIQRAALSGRVLENVAIGGNAQNIVMRQDLIGEPTTIEINGTGADGISLALRGLFNYIEEIPKERFTLEAQGVPLDGIQLADVSLLPDSIVSGVAQITTELGLTGNSFQARTLLDASGLSFAAGGASINDTNAATIQNMIIETVNRIRLDAQAAMEEMQLNFDISSNFGSLVADELQEMIGPELEKARQQVTQNIEQQVAEPRKELQGFISQQSNNIDQQMDAVNKQIEELSEFQDEKREEIKKRIRGGGTEKAKEKLEGLF